MSLGGGLPEAQACMAGSHINLPPWVGGGLPEVRHIMRVGPWLSTARTLATKAQSGCTMRGRWLGGGGKVRPQPASVALSFFPAHLLLGTSKGQGERTARLGRPGPPSPKSTLRTVESGFWNLAPRGVPGMGSFFSSPVSLFGLVT